MSALSTLNSVASATADHVFLAGRPPLNEFLGFVSSQSVDHSQNDFGPLTAAWLAANSRVMRIEQSEAGIADNAAIRELPADVSDLASAVLKSDVVRRQYGIAPFRLGMIDLDRTVVYQKQINLEHVAAIRQRLGETPSDEEVFRLCLPLDDARVDPDVHGVLAQQQPGVSQFILSSASTDLRVFTPQMVDASEVSLEMPGGVPAKFIVVPVGYSANFVSALAVNGRVLLNNGSHRAYALREAGLTHAPALIQDVSHPDLLSVLTNDEVVQRSNDFFVAPRPPLLKDYFDDDLRITLRVERKSRQVTVVTQFGQTDVPAA